MLGALGGSWGALGALLGDFVLIFVRFLFDFARFLVDLGMILPEVFTLEERPPLISRISRHLKIEGVAAM